MDLSIKIPKNTPTVKIKTPRLKIAQGSEFWISQSVSRDDGISKIVKPSTVNNQLKEFVYFDYDATYSEICTFLQLHYKYKDSKFPLKYEPSHLEWFQYKKNKKTDFYICIRHKTSQKIIGVIGCADATICYEKYIRETLIVSFMCIEERFRHKGIVPMLIKDVILKTEGHNKMTVFISGNELPFKNLSSVSIYHRPIRPKKLIKECFMNHEQRLKKYNPVKVKKVKNNFDNLYSVYKKYTKDKDLYVYFFSKIEFEQYFNRSPIITITTHMGQQFSSFVPIDNGKIKACYVLYSTSHRSIEQCIETLKKMGFWVINSIESFIDPRDKLWKNGSNIHYYLYDYDIDINKKVDIAMYII